MMIRSNLFILTLTVLSLSSCDANNQSTQQSSNYTIEQLPQTLDTAYFASGCFWCTEAVFERVKGVYDVVSGYSGGTKLNPTYSEVSAGRTNYAEAVRIAFNPTIVSYQDLVNMFYASHDPTQVNGQGPDIGKQYRSAIFYLTASEEEIALSTKKKLDESGKYSKPIATEITAFTTFYPAEDYHQDYYELHPNQPYVVSVSRPKVEKFEKEFKKWLKEKYK